mgnify:CR=1 FL=1|jgi:hypothetical protein
MTNSTISPDYYKKGSIEVTDFISDQNMSFIEGNVVKYISRYKDKAGIQDLRKARWYLDKLIELEMEGNPYEENT